MNIDFDKLKEIINFSELVNVYGRLGNLCNVKFINDIKLIIVKKLKFINVNSIKLG